MQLSYYFESVDDKKSGLLSGKLRLIHYFVCVKEDISVAPMFVYQSLYVKLIRRCLISGDLAEVVRET